MRQIVLDTETTGLEVELDHRVIEIADQGDEFRRRHGPIACADLARASRQRGDVRRFPVRPERRGTPSLPGIR